ncbi:unnamed protein product (macronuclear) [Paramecium tetraurelia]|uniref:Alpha-type protein kinase domain-containing protein n=1 Tax=Paramecium tetraurelia TaxID=5888 RepID=A0CR22_PARTE|nr:uncharacterized protein GSPATT00009552001 [Paramecium tetraurelia]CAK73239.1 unnamed protein product [Paramecium tetraurelia]|eukprot:XP_001440636.1 hypothetical protein (macronuclear) [Paramecium tetraurelia strain d4-2]
MYSKICQDSINCKNENCQLDHSRIYLGLCIRFLIMEQEWEQNNSEDDYFPNKICDKKECKLKHFDQSKFRFVSQISVNGIFPHNLCGTYDCPSHEFPSDKNSLNYCKFIHKPWAKNICLTDIINSCKKKDKDCKFIHKEWKDLKPIAKECSYIKSICPDSLCDKQNCQCSHHYLWMSNLNLCIPYLKGSCPKKNCLKNHVEWEYVNPKIYIENCIYPCTKIDDQQLSYDQQIQLQCEKAQFLKLKSTISESNIIDVVFIMDLTGSMKPWKEEMEKAIYEILQQFDQTNKGYQMRFGFVGYRDECDKNDKITYINLTHDIEKFIKQISKFEAKGGGDLAEDIVAGFEKALELNFSQHEESLLCTFLIADAPCHGRQYHDLKSDDKIDKVEENHLENALMRYKKIKECNFLCNIKINNSTDKMFSKMQAVYPLLTITTKKEPKEICEQVLFTLRQSLTKSNIIKSNLQKQVGIKADFKKFKIDENIKNSQQNKVDYWKNLLKSNYLRQGGTNLQIQKQIIESLQSEDQNCQTFVFKAFDAINNMYVVLKIPKFIVDLHKQGMLDNQSIEKAEQQAESRFYSSIYACQMAHFFNITTSTVEEIPPLFYVLPICYTLKTPFYGMTKVYGETFINIQHQFKKYTTNHHHSDPKYYYYSIFSHFSFIESGNTFVITDLQGCVNILSDPSIQTKKGEIPELDQDETNHFEKGIEIFLQTQHKECSYYCQLLQLSRDQFQIKNIQNVDLTKWQINDKTHQYGICAKCNQLIQFDLDAQKAENHLSYIMNCQQCKTESADDNIINSQCKCCKETFQSFQNLQLRCQSELGICSDCKNICSDLNKSSCCYCQTKCKKILKQLHIQDQIIYICKKGCKYLELLSCKNCQKQYQQDIVLNKEDYDQGVYKCAAC